MQFFLNTRTRELTRSITDARVVTRWDCKARDSVTVDLQLHDGVSAIPTTAFEALQDAYEIELAAWNIDHAVWVSEHATWDTVHDAWTVAHDAWLAGAYATWTTAHAAWLVVKAAYDIDFPLYVASVDAHTAWWLAYNTWQQDTYQPWYIGPRLWVAANQVVKLPITSGVTSNGDLHVRVEYATSSSVDLYVALTLASHSTDADVATAIAAAINADGTLGPLFTATTAAAVPGLFGTPVFVVLTKDTATTNDTTLKIKQYGDVGAQAGHADSPDGIVWSQGTHLDAVAVSGSPAAPSAPVFGGGTEPTVLDAPTPPGTEPVEPTFSGGTEPVEPVEPVEPTAPVEPDDYVSPDMVFALKETELEGAPTFALIDTWERIGLGLHRARISLNTDTLADAVDGLKSLLAAAEFTVNLDGTGWESSNTLAVTVHNDVVKGDEGTPTELPTPDAWLEARRPAPLALTTVPGPKPRMVITGTLTSNGSASITFDSMFYGGLSSSKAYYNPVGVGIYVVGDQIDWSSISSKWRIRKNGTIVFESTDAVTTPDLVTTWTPVGAATGTPIVTAGTAANPTPTVIGQSAIVSHSDSTKTEWAAVSLTQWLPRTAGILLHANGSWYRQTLASDGTAEYELLPNQ